MDNNKNIFFQNSKILFISFLVFLILFCLLVIGNILNNKRDIAKNPVASPGREQFSGCRSLADNCIDVSCRYYNLCQSAGADNKACKVYDCDSFYGIEITTKNDKLLTKTYEKINAAKAQENIAACQGVVSIISNKCEKNSAEILIKVNTVGECKVEAFTYQQEGEWKSADFMILPKDEYSLTLPSCKRFTEISAIGSKGIVIGSVHK